VSIIFNHFDCYVKVCIKINFILSSSNDFTTVIDLEPGTHKLKFIVDDEWKCSNDFSTATDPDGNLVNYLEVHEDDDCNSIEKESLDSSGTRNQPLFVF
jgi:hypothetical protein